MGTRRPKPVCPHNVWCGRVPLRGPSETWVLGDERTPWPWPWRGLGSSPAFRARVVLSSRTHLLGPSWRVTPRRPFASPVSSVPGREASRCRSGHGAAKSVMTAREHRGAASLQRGSSAFWTLRDRNGRGAGDGVTGEPNTHGCPSLPACTHGPFCLSPLSAPRVQICRRAPCGSEAHVRVSWRPCGSRKHVRGWDDHTEDGRPRFPRPNAAQAWLRLSLPWRLWGAGRGAAGACGPSGFLCGRSPGFPCSHCGVGLGLPHS